MATRCICVTVIILLLLPLTSGKKTKLKPEEEKCDISFKYEESNSDDLKRRFIDEFKSWRNCWNNFSTLHWSNVFKWLSQREMRKLCLCFFPKIFPNKTDKLYLKSKYELDDYADFSYTFLEMGRNLFGGKYIKRLRKYPCEFHKTVFYLLIGYKNHGLKRAYDVYAVFDGFHEDHFVGVGKEIPI